MDRYRDHSNAAAIGVIVGLVLAGLIAWGTFFVAFIALVGSH